MLSSEHLLYAFSIAIAVEKLTNGNRQGCVPYSAEHMRHGNAIVRYVVRQIEEFAEGITLLASGGLPWS